MTNRASNCARPRAPRVSEAAFASHQAASLSGPLWETLSGPLSQVPTT